MNNLISVIIPCLNEEKYIKSCLFSLLNCDYPLNLVEILVVDGGSKDNTLTILDSFRTKYPNIKVISNPKIITPVSLNIGIRNSKGKYIMIAGAHSQFPKNYISVLIEKMKEIGCDCIGGSIDTRVLNSNPVSEAIKKNISSRFGVGNSLFRTEKDETLYVDTVPFGIYNRALFEKVGNYNENLIRNHDIEFSKRLIEKGYKIVLVSSMQCVYYARESFKGLAQNNYKNGFWNILTLYITKRFRSLSIRHFVPLVFLMSIILPIFLSLIFFKYFIIISVFSLLLYTFVMLFVSIKLKDSLTNIKYILWGFFVLHFSYAFGSLVGLVRLDKLFSHKS